MSKKPNKKTSQKMLPKGIKKDANENTWLIQPTVLILMRHDYTLMQNRILTQIIDKLQFAIKEVISSYKKTKSEDINNTTLFTSSEYYDPAHPDSLKLKIYIQEFGLPPSSYEQLKESLRNISTIPVEIPYYENGRKWVSIEGLCKIEMPDDIRTRTDYINVRITKKTATYMLSVSSGYTKYIKQTIMMAKNSYTPKLYLLLCMYRDKESKVIETKYIRQFLRIENKYSIWRDVKNRILDPAQKDLERLAKEGISDFYYEWEPGYKKERVRKVGEPDYILFTYKRNQQDSQTPEGHQLLMQRQAYVYDMLRSQIIMMPEDLANDIRNRITLQNYQKVIEKIAYVYSKINEDNTIKNKSLYMYTALDNEIKEFGEEFNLKKIEPDLYKDEDYVDYEVVND